jgi:hypothetical protein
MKAAKKPRPSIPAAVDHILPNSAVTNTAAPMPASPQRTANMPVDMAIITEEITEW